MLHTARPLFTGQCVEPLQCETSHLCDSLQSPASRHRGHTPAAAIYRSSCCQHPLSICASILHLCQHPPLAMLVLVLALSPALVTAAPEAEPLLGGLYPGPGAVLGYCANQGVCVPAVHCSAHYYHLAQVQTCKPCWKMLSNFGENA